MDKLPNPLGRHLLLELYGCSAPLLKDRAQLETILLAAARAMEATVIESRFHTFQPYGVSGVVLIAESHLTIHTWPEHGYAAVDIFSCGPLHLKKGVELLQARLLPQRVEQITIQRGQLTPPDRPGTPIHRTFPKGRPEE
ncbi:MAG: adenosylmethionine decarboxylase [Bacteroidota bacterium]